MRTGENASEVRYDTYMPGVYKTLMVRMYPLSKDTDELAKERV